MSSKLKILDCTLRDGGYYNHWDFDFCLAQKYIISTENSKVDILELGFRNLPQNIFLGAFAYTTDNYIHKLKINDNTIVGVMIDASSILGSGMTIKNAINFLFQNKDNSRVDLVRIATHFDQISSCRDIVQELTILGYKIGLNIMQSNTRSTNELSAAAKEIQDWNKVSVLYFADSLGSMSNSDIVRVISALKKEWSGDLGFHAHNNKGLAVSNSLTSIENGVTWVDSTILGMGRGAGNAQTENLLLELNNNYQMSYCPESLFDLVLTDFTLLHNQYRWGYSLLYNLAALNNIHPTYIQEMLVDSDYGNREILQAINFMSLIDSSHYKKTLLLSPHRNIKNIGSWDARNWCLNKNVLILGSGNSLEKYQDAIIQYINIYKPIVISLNISQNFPKDLIDLYASSNEYKILNDYNLYSDLNKPIVVSKALVDRVVPEFNNSSSLLDYGMSVKKGTYEIRDKDCVLPYELSVGYALSLANIGSADSIHVVGLDGYSANDSRQSKMNELFNLYNKKQLIPIISLTPTSYDIIHSSVYAIDYNL